MKYLTGTYLNDIVKYNLRMYYSRAKDWVVCIKKVLKIQNPFILNEDGTEIKLIDDGYYIFEIVMLEEKYICRVFLDGNGNVIERFFTAIDNITNSYGEITYLDLKYSYVCSKVKHKEYNKESLNKLLQDGIIDENTKDRACKTIQSIKKGIIANNNFAYNMDYRKYLF